MFAIPHDHDISRFPIPAVLDDCDDPLDCDGRIAIAILHAFSSSRLCAISCAWIATSYARDDDIINRRTITTTAINPNICKALVVRRRVGEYLGTGDSLAVLQGVRRQNEA